MNKKDRYVVALDVGSTKTCALIGEMEEEGGVEICGARRSGIERLAQRPDRKSGAGGEFDSSRD